MGKKIESVKPLILVEGTYATQKLLSWKKKLEVVSVHDIFEQQLEELFTISQPHLLYSKEKGNLLKQYLRKRLQSSKNGSWAYMPWNKTLVHMVSEQEYYLLRTNRNKNIITSSEQDVLRKSVVGIAGLSIGGQLALTLSQMAIADTMKIAEYDMLETTNLNRLPGSVLDIGLPKIDIIARKIYELNPYAGLLTYPEGVTEKSLESFFKTPKPQIVIDAIDDLRLKIKLRLEARKHKVAVIMATNIGDALLIDVERYDLNPKLQLFNGRIGDVPEKILKTNIPKEEENKYVIQIVGKEHISQRVLESVFSIGKTLVGRPQLLSSIITSTGITAYFIRNILLKKNVPSDRRFLPFASLGMVQ